MALDTNIFVYQLEDSHRDAEFTKQVFGWLQQPGHSAVTSTITMTELLVQPHRNLDRKLVNHYYALLSTYPNLEWVPPDLETADTAARLRAKHRMRTPDALLAATGIQSRVSGMITNDPVFERVDRFETLVLDSL